MTSVTAASNLSISDGELLLRLALTVGLCGAIGLEREARGQVAGLRTHILVGLGAALFTLVSAYAFDADEPGSRVDPTRIAAQIVTGIGFLGAGTIIRQGLTVRGLTTAASLWIVAAVGMASGAGYYLGAAATTGAVLVSLIGFRRIRPLLMSTLRTDLVLLEIEMDEKGELGAVLEALGRHGVRVDAMESEREEGLLGFRLELQVPPGSNLEGAIDAIRRLPATRRVEARGAGSPSQATTAFDT
jgi:putative Mg2+ transporter-C (MgtC) family protein